MELTTAQIRYLLTIRDLREERLALRSVDLSRRLGVSKPSAHRMLSQLEELGLLRKKPCGAVEITEQGEEAVRRCGVEHRRLTACLAGALSLPPETAGEAAPALMSHMDRETLRELHGSVLPPKAAALWRNKDSESLHKIELLYMAIQKTIGPIKNPSGCSGGIIM